MKVKQGKSVICMFLKINLSTTISMKRSRRKLFINMVVDRDILWNNLITLIPLFYLHTWQVGLPKTGDSLHCEIRGSQEANVWSNISINSKRSIYRSNAQWILEMARKDSLKKCPKNLSCDSKGWAAPFSALIQDPSTRKEDPIQPLSISIIQVTLTHFPPTPN